MKKNNPTSWGCLLLFIGPFIVIGAGLAGYTSFHAYNALRSSDWEAVEAVVESTGISRSDSNEGGVTYKTNIAYRYEYDQVVYEGNRVCYAYAKSNTEQHKAIYGKIKNAAIVQVYVNPEKPSESTLIKGWSNQLINMIIFMLMWNSFILAFVFNKAKNVWFYVIAIWIFGFGKLILGVGEIDMPAKIEVLSEQ